MKAWEFCAQHEIVAGALLRGLGKVSQHIGSQRGLLLLEARKRGVVDEQGCGRRSRRDGRRGRAAAQEADLADRGSSAADRVPFRTDRRALDVDPTIRDQVHVPVVVALATQDGAWLKALQPAERLH